MISTNVEKLIFVAFLLTIQLVLVVIVHRRSGESALRVQQIDRKGSRVIDLVAIACLILLVGILLPVLGRTGPPWRRPSLLVEFALRLPVALAIGLICGFSISIARRHFRYIAQTQRSVYGCLLPLIGLVWVLLIPAFIPIGADRYRVPLGLKLVVTFGYLSAIILLIYPIRGKAVGTTVIGALVSLWAMLTIIVLWFRN